jgi:hypothetical protein
MIKSRSILFAFAAGTVALASCSASSTDFKKAAEKAIKDYKGGTITFTAATCETPPDNKVNTTFTCTGTGSDSNTYNFIATITSKTRVEVASAPDGSATPSTDATGGSTVDTTPVSVATGDSTVATDAVTATSAP